MSAKTILITGASGGIGAALARAYAAPGVCLVLWGRDQARLAAAAAQCRTRGAEAQTASFDLADIDGFIERLEAADAAHPIDLAIFNAGIGGSVAPGRLTQEARAAADMAAVNFAAPVAGANLIGEKMAQRGGGRIVLVGSIAESFPLPMAPAYAGTKAGLALFAEALGLRLGKHGVGVTLVSPAFVDTPMSRSLREPRPFLIDADRAAAIIARRVNRGARRVVFPWQFAVLGAVARFLPRPLVRAVLAQAAKLGDLPGPERPL